MDFTNFQTAIEEQIYKVNSVYQKPIAQPVNILSKFREIPLDLARTAMGSFGEKLYYFSRDIDIDHPDLKNIFDGQLTSVVSGSFSQDACELLEICKFAADNLYLSILSKFDRVITKNHYYKSISKIIHSPFQNLLNIRFLPFSEDRTSIRWLKKDFVVNLNSSSEIGYNSFDAFVRNYDIYGEQIKEANCKAEHFYNLKCPILAHEIEKTVEHLKSIVKDRYYGFNRISLLQTALIMAKLMGYEFSDVIYVKKSDFPYKFWKTCSHNNLAYTPMLYPYHMLILSKRVSDLINYLDNFPEIGYRALFDNYWVLVPTVGGPSLSSVLSPSGEEKSFSSLREARKYLDNQLISSKTITPVLLGERNENFYFIGFCV